MRNKVSNLFTRSRLLGLINARYKRLRTLHVPKLMEMDQNNRIALNSRHVKVDL